MIVSYPVAFVVLITATLSEGIQAAGCRLGTPPFPDVRKLRASNVGGVCLQGLS